MGRPLTADERRVILRILDADFDGAEALRHQVGEAFATGHWVEGLPSIDIMVGESSPAAPGQVGSPLTRTVIDDSGTHVGFVMLWIQKGRISALEYAWVTDEAPTDLPPDEWISDDPG